jgi:hypothetical protein
MNIKIKENVVAVILLVVLSAYVIDYNRNFMILTQNTIKR